MVGHWPRNKIAEIVDHILMRIIMKKNIVLYLNNNVFFFQLK